MRRRAAALLGALVEAKFLFQTRDGAFMRIEHASPAKARLRSRANNDCRRVAVDISSGGGTPPVGWT